MKGLWPWLGIGVLVLAPRTVGWGDPLVHFDLDGGGGWLRGQEMYRIGGAVTLANGRRAQLHFPLSELRFPYHGPMGILRAILDVPSAARLVGTVQGSLTPASGCVEDRDWLKPGWPTVSSEADNETTILIAELLLQRPIDRPRQTPFDRPPSLTVLFLVGYRYQSFDHEVRHLRQWYPAHPELGVEEERGLVATYATRYHIPWLGFGLAWDGRHLGDRFSIPLYVHGYAGGAGAALSDEDRHLLREKISESKNVGLGLLAGVELRAVVMERFVLAGGGEYWRAKTTGRQRQYWDHSGRREWIGELDSESEQEHWTVSGRVGLRF